MSIETGAPQLKFPEVMFPGRIRADQAVRNKNSMFIQRDFLLKMWAPALTQIGVTNRELWGRLLLKFLHPMGNVYRETDVTDEAFLGTLQTFTENMMLHLQQLKWYLHAADWSEVVEMVETASDPEFVFRMKSGAVHEVLAYGGRPVADPTDEVNETLFDVYLPNVSADGEACLQLHFPTESAIKPEELVELRNYILSRTRANTHLRLAA